jgi:polar amino acid transport system substrate-binding protein
VVAFAGGRQRLLSGTRDVPGLRMLEDNFYGVPQTIAVPLDRPDRLQWINETLVELRSSGFLADVIARSGIEGITVAPAGVQDR